MTSFQEKVSKKDLPTLLKNREYKPPVSKRIRECENFTFYGVTKTKAGSAEISLALKLVMADNSQLIIQYHELMSPMKYNGVDEIEITTPTLSVTIKGKNLDDIIDYLAEHRLVWIKEPDSDFLLAKEKTDNVEIEEIRVKMG